VSKENKLEWNQSIKFDAYELSCQFNSLIYLYEDENNEFRIIHCPELPLTLSKLKSSKLSDAKNEAIDKMKTYIRFWGKALNMEEFKNEDK
jgi:hypothetical protein